MVPSKKHFRKRDAILSCLRGTKAHPSAETLYAQLKPGIPPHASRMYFPLLAK